MSERRHARNLRFERQLHLHVHARDSGQATGTYAIGVEAERLENILAGTTRPSRWRAERRIRSSTSPWTARRCSRAAPWWLRQLQSVPRRIFRCTEIGATTPNTACCATIRRTRTSRSVNGTADKAPPQTHQFQPSGSSHSRRRERRADGGKPYIVVGFGGSTQRFLRRALSQP